LGLQGIISEQKRYIVVKKPFGLLNQGIGTLLGDKTSLVALECLFQPLPVASCFNKL
jgi:hypothetical protein